MCWLDSPSNVNFLLLSSKEWVDQRIRENSLSWLWYGKIVDLLMQSSRILWSWSSVVPLVWRPDVNHLIYRRAEDHRQDHRPPRANLWRWTATSAPICPTATPDGSWGAWGIFLKPPLAVFCWFEGGFYLKLEGLVVSVDLFRFLSRWPCRFGFDTVILGC